MSNFKPIDPAITEICRQISITGWLKGRGVELKKSGRNMKCCCPLPEHADDDTPSFNIRVMPDGVEMFKCFGCLPETQRVLSIEGTKEAGKVEIGDMLTDVYGNPTTVMAVKRHENRNPIYRIKTTIDHCGFCATSDHDMLWLPKPNCQQGLIEGTRKSDILYEIEMRHLRKKMWVPVAISKPGKEKVSISLELRKGRYQRRIVEVPITRKFSWLCGLYCAEGSISGNRLIAFDVHTDEGDDVRKKIQSALDEIGLKAKAVLQPLRQDRSDTKGRTITVCCSGLARWLKAECGHHCHEKKMPSCFRRTTLDVQASWACGAYDGDGNSTKSRFAVTSRMLVDEMFRIALMCGAIPTKSKPISNEGKLDVFPMGFKHGSLSDIYEVADGREFEPRTHKDSCHVNIDQNWMLAVRITDIEMLRKRHLYVIDIETDGSHTYSCQTIAVHNCGAAGNILTLMRLMTGEKPRTIRERLAAQTGVSLLHFNEYAKTEPLNSEVLEIFCEEDEISIQIAQVALVFMQTNCTRDAINKVSRLYEAVDRMAEVGNAKALKACYNNLGETIRRYKRTKEKDDGKRAGKPEK